MPLGPDHRGLCWLRAHPGAVPGGEPPSVTLGASTWCLNSTSRGQQPSVTAPCSPGMQAVMWPPDLGGPARSREDAQEAGPSCPAHRLLLAPASLSPGHSHSHFSALCWSLQPQYLLPCPALGLHLYKLEPRVPGLWSLRILGYQPEISSLKPCHPTDRAVPKKNHASDHVGDKDDKSHHSLRQLLPGALLTSLTTFSAHL